MAAVDGMSKDQFRELADKVNDPEEAGFTVEAFGDRNGVRVPPNPELRDAYVVAHAHYNRDIPAIPGTTTPRHITPEMIGGYTAARERPLRVPGNYLGGFADIYDDLDKDTGEIKRRATGAVSLDVSAVHPATTQGKMRAEAFASIQGEKEYGYFGPEGSYSHSIPTPRYYPPYLGGAHVWDALTEDD
jgi:hypothetical protein